MTFSLSWFLELCPVLDWVMLCGSVIICDDYISIKGFYVLISQYLMFILKLSSHWLSITSARNVPGSLQGKQS